MEYGAIVWDSYTTNDINQLKRIQRCTARFIPGNYKSKEEGSITNMVADLELENLQSRRTSKRLVFLYWVVQGLVLAINHVEILMKSKTKRIIKLLEDFESANIVIDSARSNSKALETTLCETEQ